MLKQVIPAMMIMLMLGITGAVAAPAQKADALSPQSATAIKQAAPERPAATITPKAVPFQAAPVDADAARLAHAVLPQVVYPTMSHHLGYEGKKFAITVRFNTDMDRSTVIAGGSVILDFPKAANAPGLITWINEREFKWVQLSNNRFNICIYDPDCEFKLTLTDAIRSKEGLKLDGDHDNKQGGNFVLWLLDIG